MALCLYVIDEETVPPLHHNWLSPWTRITQCNSGCMMGRTHVFPTLVQHFFHNSTDVPLVLFFHYHDSFQNLYKPLFPPRKLHMAFQSHVIHLTFWAWANLSAASNHNGTWKIPPVLCIASPESISPKLLLPF